MAGGTWKNQDKVQPGTYINTKSEERTLSKIGSRGTVAIAEMLSWGPIETVQEITPGDELRPLIGYDESEARALFLREMMKGSDNTQGPVKILLYRLGGTEGEKAAATIGGLTVTALYEGIRGNDISVMVQEDPDAEGSYDVTTVLDGTIVDIQTVKEISGLKSNTWVIFGGEGALTESAGQNLEGGADPEASAADYAKFLTAIEPYRFDILAYDGNDSATVQAVAAFVERISNSIGKKCQAVMANAADCDSEWVISVNNGVKLSDGTALTAQQAVWWAAGAEAGALYNQSLTYARYPDAVEAYPKKTDMEVTAAILAGEMVFIDDYGEVKVCSDINTLTTYTKDRQKEYSKNRVLRTLNQFCNDVNRNFGQYYIGKTSNVEEGRNLLKGWIVGYLNDMQANNGIQNFVAEDINVRPGTDTDAVLIDVSLQPVDSIEKIYMTVPVRTNALIQ